LILRHVRDARLHVNYASSFALASKVNGGNLVISIHGDLNMEFVTGLKCVFCGATYSTRVPYTCPACGITGMLDVQYDYPAIARRLNRRTLAKRAEFSHWRYRELLPIRKDAVLPALPVGWTPVVPADSLARHLGLKTLYLKDDGRNPTGSLKDRASSVGVVKAREKRQKIIACASTGNAASSLAGMAASMGLQSVIFVPERAPEPKVTQLLVFGATVLRVRGSYEDAFQMCQGACERWGWYNRNSAINPYLVEGKKTVGLEICEQLAWQVPDWVAVSVGDGCTIAGVWKAFHEMKTLGLIARTPQMLGVQAAGAAPVTTAFRTGEALKPIEPQTIADSIAVGVPRNWKKAVLAIQASGGTMINVEDEEILEAMRSAGRLAGIFAEPAAATAVAGVRRAVEEGIIGRRASVLAVVTGNGLKDIRSAQSAVTKPFDIAPDGSGLEEILRDRQLIS
jgi:threonine synthase